MTPKSYAPIYDYIVRYKTENDGLSPTHREISDAFGMNSTSLAAYALRDLERAGLIRLGTKRSRGIAVVGGKWTLG